MRRAKMVKNWNKFITHALYDIASDIISRIDDIDEDDDETDAIFNAMDNELIYTCDQWKIIEEYSTPDEPKSFSEVWEEFFNDLYSAIEWEEVE